MQAERDTLVQQAIAGDYQAFEQLVSPHERRLYALAWHLTHDHHDAQDVVQNALLAAIEHLPEFRAESSFATWLTRITVNYALKLLRGRRLRKGLSLDLSDGDEQAFVIPQHIAGWREDPQQALDHRELRELLDQGIEQLPQGQRLVFVLRDVEGLSVAETAEAIDISQANVKVRLLRARLALREYLTRRFGDGAVQHPFPADHDHEALGAALLAAGKRRPSTGGSKS